MKVSVDRTYTFDENAVREVIVRYMRDTGVPNIKPQDLVIKVQSERNGSGYGSSYQPAKLLSISATTKEQV